ncbi:MAG: proton-conducting transporter membrane subunit [Methanobacteriota archaeon]
MNAPDYVIPLIVATPLLGAFLTPLVSRLGEKIRQVFVLVILGITGVFIGLLGSDVFTSGVPRTYIFGAKNLSLPVVRILFEVDSMSLFMALVSFVLVLVAVIYSWSFMKEHDGLDKYYTLLLLLFTAMLGMELTGDLFNFFVFLEITCISSAALIAFWVYKPEAVEAAFKYIVVSAIGALFILFAIGLLYAQYNALNIGVIGSLLQFTFLDKIALVLFLVVLTMKAGLVPMHMWLPDSYGQAPHAATLVIIGATQASLYGLLRICFTLYGNVFNEISPVSSMVFGGLITGLALLAIFVGVIMALMQTDFTRLIAYAAVAEVGYILLGIGVRLSSVQISFDALGLGHVVTYPAYGVTALQGSVFHIFNDVLDIGLLFLVAGAVYYATKERSLDNLAGLSRQMKYTTVFFIIGFLAISGMPPMNGFASKLMLYESTFQLNPILGIVAILCSILLLAVFVKVFYSVFLGPQLPHMIEVKEVPRSMLIAMAIIAGLIIFIGLFPDLILQNLVQPATQALFGYKTYFSQVIMGGI